MRENTAPNPAAPEPEADPMEELKARLAPQLEEMQERLVSANEQVKTFIRKNPGTTLLGAAALGFLIGKWASRR